jgi:glycerol-3-phosphate dehydrogenase
VAVKIRVHPGMGRCQGGFCEPLIVQILARELGISPFEVNYNGKDSPILLGPSKGESK